MNKLFFSMKLYRSKISTLGMIHRSETPHGELKLRSRETESPGICFPPGESYMSLVSMLKYFPGCTPFPMVPCDGVYHVRDLSGEGYRLQLPRGSQGDAKWRGETVKTN